MRLALPRCTIRSWRRADAESLVRNANHAEVAANMRDRFPHPYTAADADFFLSMCEKQSPTTFFAIEVDGEAAGGIGITLHDDVERVAAEIGYWLGPAFWGRGVVTEALQAVTGWAFTTFPLTRVYAVPFATNAASVRVLEKAGYTLEGRMRRSAIKGGQVLDQLLYAIVR